MNWKKEMKMNKMRYYHPIKGKTDKERIAELKEATEGDVYLSKDSMWRFQNGKWKLIWMAVNGIKLTEAEYIQLKIGSGFHNKGSQKDWTGDYDLSRERGNFQQ